MEKVVGSALQLSPKGLFTLDKYWLKTPLLLFNLIVHKIESSPFSTPTLWKQCVDG